MPYMMSDLAAGSTAVEQLQKNVAEAPYIQDLTKAAAERRLAEDRAAPEEVKLRLEEKRLKSLYAPEEAQLKLEEDRLKLENARLKALYAPQETALKLQQDQQIIETTKLSNILSQAKIDMTAEKKSAIEKLTKDPEWSKLSPEDQSRKLAAAVMSIDPTEGERLIKIADSEQAKSYINKLKEHETNRQKIGDALATVRSATDEQFQGLLDKMPEDMKKAIKMQIPGFFEEKDPKLQKAQLEALMYNGEGKNNMAANEQRLKVLEEQNKIAETRARIAEQQLENIKAKGASDAAKAASKVSDKADKAAAAEAKREDREYAQSRREAARIEFKYKKPLEEATAAFKAAVKEEEKRTGLFGMFESKASAAKSDPSKKEELASTKAWREIQQLKMDMVDERLAALEGMPEGKEKDRLFNALMKEKQSIDTTSYAPDKTTATGKLEDTAAAKKDVPKTDAKPTVPSNKPAPKKLTQAENDAAIAKANEAIKNGADPEKVKARLREAGVSFKE